MGDLGLSGLVYTAAMACPGAKGSVHTLSTRLCWCSPELGNSLVRLLWVHLQGLLAGQLKPWRLEEGHSNHTDAFLVRSMFAYSGGQSILRFHHPLGVRKHRCHDIEMFTVLRAIRDQNGKVGWEWGKWWSHFSLGLSNRGGWGRV